MREFCWKNNNAGDKKKTTQARKRKTQRVITIESDRLHRPCQKKNAGV